MRQWSDDGIGEQLYECLGSEHEAHLDRFTNELLMAFLQFCIVAGILCTFIL